jgi:hypothetical protein
VQVFALYGAGRALRRQIVDDINLAWWLFQAIFSSW